MNQSSPVLTDKDVLTESLIEIEARANELRNRLYDDEHNKQNDVDLSHDGRERISEELRQLDEDIETLKHDILQLDIEEKNEIDTDDGDLSVADLNAGM
jgi:hypothetical protein